MKLLLSGIHSHAKFLPPSLTLCNSQNDNGSILERLSALEEAVQSLRQHASPEEQAQYAITKNTSFTFDSSEYHAPLPEGDMSFSKQALHASQVAELTSSKVSQLPSLMNELSSLRNQGASEPRRKEYISGPRRELSNVDVELPPSSFVLRVLRAIKESPGHYTFPYFPHTSIMR